MQLVDGNLMQPQRNWPQARQGEREHCDDLPWGLHERTWRAIQNETAMSESLEVVPAGIDLLTLSFDCTQFASYGL